MLLNNIVKLFNLHYEYLTIISKKNVKIAKFSDIFDKKINIGNVGSGSRVLFSKMIRKFDKNLSNFDQIFEKSGSKLYEVLCNHGQADVAVYTVGHPNKGFQKLANCDTKINSISQSEINKFLAISPKYFFQAQIPPNTYLNQPRPINTFALNTILFANKDFDKEILKDFLKIIEKHKSELVMLQPSLHTLFEQDLLSLLQ